MDSGFNSIKTRCPGTEAAFIQTCWFWSRMQDFFPGEWKVNVHDLQKMHGAGGVEPAGSRLGKRLCGLHIFSLPRSSQLSLLNLQHIKEGSARGGMCQDPTVSYSQHMYVFSLLPSPAQKKIEPWSAASRNGRFRHLIPAFSTQVSNIEARVEKLMQRRPARSNAA